MNARFIPPTTCPQLVGVIEPEARQPDAYDVAAHQWVREGTPPSEWALPAVQDALARQPGLAAPAAGWELPRLPVQGPWAKGRA